MKDCAWCGLPLEILTTWERRGIEMAVARCLNDHWYGGPKQDLMGEWA